GMTPRRSKPPRAALGTALLVGMAIAVAIAPIPPAWIERVYSTGLYPLLQPSLTFISNAAPFALLDALIVAVAAAFLWRGWQDARRDRGWRAARRIPVRLVVWGAAAYLAFLVLWGFNYRRVRIADRLPFDQAAITRDAAARLAATSLDRVNAGYAAAHAE